MSFLMVALRAKTSISIQTTQESPANVLGYTAGPEQTIGAPFDSAAFTGNPRRFCKLVSIHDTANLAETLQRPVKGNANE